MAAAARESLSLRALVVLVLFGICSAVACEGEQHPTPKLGPGLDPPAVRSDAGPAHAADGEDFGSNSGGSTSNGSGGTGAGGKGAGGAGGRTGEKADGGSELPRCPSDAGVAPDAGDAGVDADAGALAECD